MASRAPTPGRSGCITDPAVLGGGSMAPASGAAKLPVPRSGLPLPPPYSDSGDAVGELQWEVAPGWLALDDACCLSGVEPPGACLRLLASAALLMLAERGCPGGEATSDERAMGGRDDDEVVPLVPAVARRVPPFPPAEAPLPPRRVPPVPAVSRRVESLNVLSFPSEEPGADTRGPVAVADVQSLVAVSGWGGANGSLSDTMLAASSGPDRSVEGKASASCGLQGRLTAAALTATATATALAAAASTAVPDTA